MNHRAPGSPLRPVNSAPEQVARKRSRQAAVAVSALLSGALLFAGCESAKSLGDEKQEALDSAVTLACAHDFNWQTHDGYEAGEAFLDQTVDDANDEAAAVSEAEPNDDTVFVSSFEVIRKMKDDCPDDVTGYGLRPPAPNATATPTPTSTPIPTPEPEPVEPEESDDFEGLDSGIAEALTDRGLTRFDVEELGRMADITGYGLSPETSLSFEQAAGFAYAITLACDEAAINDDWDDRITEDMSMGAPHDMATQMNHYMRDEFCPKLN